MKKFLWLICSLIILCLSLTGCFSKNRSSSPISVGDSINGKYLSNQVLVKIKPGSDINNVIKAINGKVIQYVSELDYYKISFTVKDKLNVAVARRILVDSNQVILAEPNFLYQADVTPNDPDYAKQWGFEKIHAPSGWDQTTGLNSVVVAVVDTGIDHTHPDLQEKIITGYNAIYNMPGAPGDDNGHGTHCAGIISAATNNNIGVAGVAWSCSLMPVKVLNQNGSGDIATIAAGIVWAADNGADVISMSLGGEGYSRILEDAIDYAIGKNVTVVASAGNDSRLKFNSPACLPGVISVGATNPNNTKATFSTESNSLFIAAPGEQIYSTFPQASGQLYKYLSGTSMAAPFVSGAVALIKARFGKELSVTQVQSQLKRTTTDIGSTGWDQQTGWGLLNLQGALGELQANEFGTLIVTTEGNGQIIPDTQVLLCSNGKSIANISSDSEGKAIFWSLPVGVYTVTVIKNGYSKDSTVVVSAGGTTNASLSYLPSSISYASLNETADQSSAQVEGGGTWALTSATSHSGTRSWTDSPDGNYLNGTDMALNVIPINMNGSTNPRLTFWHRYAMENYCDYSKVEVSDDFGITWTQLKSWTGIQNNWTQVSINLEQYQTSSFLLIRFRLTTDGSVINDGWYIDDITISESISPPTIAYTSLNETAENSPSQVSSEDSWSKTTTTSHSGSSCWADIVNVNNLEMDSSLMINPLNMVGSTNPRLNFWHKYSTYNNFGVEVSTTNGQSWFELRSWSGTVSTWQYITVNLDDFKNCTNLLIRFRITREYSSNCSWYIDDITIGEWTPPSAIAYTSFNETAENSLVQIMTEGTWNKTTTTSHSGSSCWTDSPAGNYSNNCNMLLKTVYINLLGSTAPKLKFWHKYRTEMYCDYCFVEVSTDGGETWSLLQNWTGDLSTWTEVQIDLSTYKTCPYLQLRFRIQSDGSATYDGWYIDDITISET